MTQHIEKNVVPFAWKENIARVWVEAWKPAFKSQEQNSME